MEKTRIIHIITRLDKGGSAESTLLTTCLLDHKKYEIFLVCGLSLESNMSPEEEKSAERDRDLARTRGIKIITISSLIRRLSFSKDLRALMSIYKLIKQLKPHIVHTHTSKAGMLGRLAAYMAGVPIIIHTPHGHVFHSYYSPFKTKLFIFAERLLSYTTDKITALTDRERDEHLSVGVGSIEKYVVIHSGVILKWLMNMSIDISAMKQELGILPDSTVIGVIGRLVPIKGHKYLVSAMQDIIRESRNTVLVFVGDGHLRAELEEMAEDLGVRNNIIFTGWRSNSHEILYTFDVFVLPSLNEGMGRVLIEAMALGKPIVASKVGGIIDLVKNGENGILVPPRDSDALGKAVLQLIKDKSLAERLGKNGKSIVYPKYDASAMVKKLDDLYEDLLSKLRLPRLINTYSHDIGPPPSPPPAGDKCCPPR